MKQWLNAPVTNGCMIRALLICVFAFLLLASAIDVAFNVGGSHWTTISATTLIVLGIIIGPVGSLLVYLSTDKHHPTNYLPLVSVASFNMTSEQAFELLRKQEEDYLKTSFNQEFGTLIVSTRKENRVITVYLLSRGEFFKCKTSKEREDTKKMKRATVTRESFGLRLLFAARFRDLQPGRYNSWIGSNIDKPKSVIVQIDKGVVSELDLDWRN